MLLSWERNARSVKKTAKQNKTYMSNKPHNQKKKTKEFDESGTVRKTSRQCWTILSLLSWTRECSFYKHLLQTSRAAKTTLCFARLLFKHTFVSERTQTGCGTTCERRRVKKDRFFDATCLVRPKHPQPSFWRKNPYFLYSIRYMNKV